MEEKIIWLILGIGLVNYLPRAVPLLFLSRVKIPEDFILWLGFVPAAAMAALVAPDIFLVQKKLNLTWHNLFLLAAIPSFIVALKTKSLGLTLIAGMVSLALLQLTGL